MTTLFALPSDVHGTATFSPDNRFRYSLERRWDSAKPQFVFVLLNPSEAGADRDDRTSQRLHALTAANGGGGYELVNLFAMVDTHQQDLAYPAAIGHTAGENDERITQAVERSDAVVLGWGDGNGAGASARARKAGVRRRATEVWPLVRFSRPQCFKVNASGSPGHPLYLKAASPLTAYAPRPEYL